MPQIEKSTIEYAYVKDGQECFACDAVLLEGHGSIKVISHKATVDVQYLVEYPSGDRRWMKANR